MTAHCTLPTIASEAAYTDWLADADQLLAAKGLDVAEAHDWYSWRAAWEDGDSTRQAVRDYETWMKMEA
ncbi:hypothetical protein ACRAVF_19130 [Bradyrhizobium oligotrophicum S58]